MKLKKAGALGLSCVIALGSMAGCGSSKEKEKTDGKEEISGEIRYAFWDTTQQPYFEKCIEKFNEQYPDVKVTLEPSSVHYFLFSYKKRRKMHLSQESIFHHFFLAQYLLFSFDLFTF